MMVIDFHAHLFKRDWLPEKFWISEGTEARCAGNKNNGQVMEEPGTTTRKCEDETDVFVMLSLLILLGMAGWTPAANAEEKVINIGHINPLTGPVAPWRVPISRGLDCLAEHYNERGGINADGTTWKIIAVARSLVGMEHRRSSEQEGGWKSPERRSDGLASLEVKGSSSLIQSDAILDTCYKMIHEDNKYQGEMGRAAGEKLISRYKVKAIIGDFAGDSLLAYRTLANRNKVIIFAGSSGAEKKLLGPKYPYLFQVSQTQAQKFLVLDIAMDTLKKKGAKLKRVASINPDTSTGRGVSQSFTIEKAPRYGMEVVASVLYPTGTKDFYPFCTKIMAGKPDIVEMGAAGPGDQALIRKTLYQLGYRGYSVASGFLVNVAGLFPILNRRRGQAGGSLSGSEQQMLAIAGALMSSPRAILMDEPTLGLSPLVCQELANIIRDLNTKGGISILLVEQNARMALNLGDRGYVLEGGKIALEDRCINLKQNAKVIQAYLGQ